MRGVISAFPVSEIIISPPPTRWFVGLHLRVCVFSPFDIGVDRRLPAETENNMGKSVTRVKQARRYLVARNVAIIVKRHTRDSYRGDEGKPIFQRNCKFVPCSADARSCSLVPNRKQYIDKSDQSDALTGSDQSALEDRDVRSRWQSVIREASPSGTHLSLGKTGTSPDGLGAACGREYIVVSAADATNRTLRQPGATTWRGRRNAHG